MSIKLGSSDISKMYLGNQQIEKIYKGNILVFENSTSVELVTESAAATQAYESNDLNGWSSHFDSIETTEVRTGLYSYRLGFSNPLIAISSINFTGLNIGDTVTIDFWAKGDVVGLQSFNISGTNDNTPIIAQNTITTDWVNYTKTVEMTSDTLNITVFGVTDQSPTGSYIYIDDLSITVN